MDIYFRSRSFVGLWHQLLLSSLSALSLHRRTGDDGDDGDDDDGDDDGDDYVGKDVNRKVSKISLNH